ncbi:hypothetical protein PTKU64_30150 [Paraburkholderia terrae]|uniref:Uncharacterized protein n=1 Tax=Paraburkholderia terrae TaxID=311230 RepID=A0ABN6JEG9_9BURK|nr:hypothetical protein PTKU64_30150 [Paraburkholderia terrae]
MGICGPLHARPNTLPADEMYSRITVPLPSVVCCTVYDADAAVEEEGVVAPELADDALRITAMPFDDGAATVRVVALDPEGGVIGSPPSAAFAGSGTSRTGSEQQNPRAEANTARLKRIDMVVCLPQSTADNARNSRARLVDSGSKRHARAAARYA